MTTLDPFDFARAEAAPAAAEAEITSGLIARWRSTRAAFDEEPRGLTDEEVDAFTDAVYVLVEQMTEIPAVNMKDLAAKAEISRDQMLDNIGHGPIGKDNALFLSLLDDIERIAGDGRETEAWEH